MSAESEKLADFSGHDSTTEQTEVQKKGWKSLSKVCIVFFFVAAWSKWGQNLGAISGQQVQ